MWWSELLFNCLSNQVLVLSLVQNLFFMQLEAREIAKELVLCGLQDEDFAA